MNIGKLKKKLAREARANPAKAGVLGVLLLVAAYFWAPLVWGFVKPGAAGTSADDTLAANSVAAGVMGGLGVGGVAAGLDSAGWLGADSGSSNSTAASVTWMEISDWMTQEPATKAADLSHRRDPFSDPERLAAEQRASRQAAAAPAPVDLSPEELGLEVTGTILGGGRRMALVDGKPFAEQDMIRVQARGRALDFRIVRIEASRVVLQRDERLYELAIPERQPTGSMEVSFND